MSAASRTRDTIVLLVEDDRDDFYLTQCMLQSIQRETHSIIWASSYEAAKQELEERPIDVALVDYRIDGRTGLEFISQVGSNYPHCPMILLTGLQDPGIDLAAQEAGAVDYLAKDSLTTELLDRSIRYARQNTQRYAFLDRVLTNASAGVISVNMHDMPTVWNRCATDALALVPPIGGKITSAVVRDGLIRIMVEGKYPSEFESTAGRTYSVNLSGGPDGGSVFVFHDISARTRTENLLRQAAADAEAASQAKSNFLATMSHELRTPLAGILGMTRVLSQTALDPSQHEHLSVIRTSGESLLQIINDILDLSKIESGKVTLDDVDYEMDHIVDDVARLLAPTVYAKGLELAIFVDPMLPKTMRGDPLRIRQILIDLVGNAIKFTNEGAVSILVKSEIIDKRPTAHVMICDTGAGIEADKVELLFKRFSQVDSSNTRRHSGTGLGLALCKELTRLMNGNIWYEPGQTCGSIFHLTLDAPAENAAVINARRGAAQSKAGSSVILATAHEPLAYVFECYAAAMGLKAIWKPTAAAAIAAIQQASPTAVIVDGTLNDLDPRALSSATRRIGFSRGPALLSIDHYPTRGAQTAPGALRYDAILLRPFGLELFDTLKAQLDRATAAPTAATAAGKAPEAAVPSGKLRILMAEDNAPNRLVAGALLRSAGYELEIAEDGLEVVEKAFGRPYDVILMDVQMPRLDGIQATRQVRSQERLRNIPIIGLSAGAMKKDRDNCIEAGMSDYLSKPIDWDKLLTLLSAIEGAIKKSSKSNAA